jgi:copper homeostasis protein CutC
MQVEAENKNSEEIKVGDLVYSQTYYYSIITEIISVEEYQLVNLVSGVIYYADKTDVKLCKNKLTVYNK